MQFKTISDLTRPKVLASKMQSGKGQSSRELTLSKPWDGKARQPASLLIH